MSPLSYLPTFIPLTFPLSRLAPLEQRSKSGAMFHDEFAPAEDNSTNAEKLEKYSGDVDWSYLKPHYEAGNLVYVDPSLDLKTAGLAFAEDNKDQVQAWLKSGDLVQPCDLHTQHWDESGTRFNAMIVRPFILAQPIS